MSILKGPDLPKLPQAPNAPSASGATSFAANNKRPMNFGTKSLIGTGAMTGLARKAKTVKRSLIGSAE